MNRIVRWKRTLATLALAGWAAMGAAAEPGWMGLSLDEALARALDNHPLLAEAEARSEAAAGRTRQAGLWPNPELTVGAEQLRSDPDLVDTRESVAGLSQQIPLGGRAGKAREVARLEQEAARHEREVVRREVERRVRGAFATALFQQEALKILDQGMEDHGQAMSFARARLQAGELVPVDIAASEMAGARLSLERDRCREATRLAREALALAMGEPERVPEALAGDLDASCDVPALEDLLRHMDQHPEALREAAAVGGALARLALAKAARIPDVEVGVLFRRLEATNEERLDLGVNLPLPMFDRGQGQVAEARAEARAAGLRQRLVLQERRQSLREDHQRLREAMASYQAHMDVLVPQAERTLHAAEARAAVGDLNHVDLLETRLEVMRVRLDRLEALRGLMQAWADLSPHTVRG